jgi:hypothetical protein
MRISKALLVLSIIAVLAVAVIAAETDPTKPGGPLVVGKSKCDVLGPTSISGSGASTSSTSGNAYWCSPNGNWVMWEKTTKPVMHECSAPVGFTIPPAPEGMQASCCDVGTCWNGTDIISNQSLDTAYNDPKSSTVMAGGKGYRCIDGDWKALIPKTTWDNDYLGYCPETDTVKRCVVKPGLVFPTSGVQNIQNNDMPEKYSTTPPACIKSRQFIGDHLCDETGTWTTRTKFIALLMLRIKEQSFAGQPYSIFCDTIDSVFGQDSPAVINDCKMTSGGKTGSCHNNVCLLRVGGVSLVGTSLNNNINDDNTFIKVIDKNLLKTVCDNVVGGSDTFTKCSQGVSTNIYYNKDLNIVLYSQGVTPASGSAMDALNQQLLKQKDVIIQAREPAPGTSGEDFAFFGKRNNINVFYAAQNAGKELWGVIEYHLAVQPLNDTKKQQPADDFKDVIGVHYAGATFNICGFITSNTKDLTCTPPGQSSDVIITQLRNADQTTIIGAWRDLTAKLRP